MGNRWSRSVALARRSVEVLRGNPALMAFPIVSGLVSLAITLTFFLPLVFLYWGHPPKQVSPAGYALMAVYYLVSYFVVIFFNVGLASCTYASLRGERPTFGDGMRFAAGRLPAILGWTALSATVGLVLQFVGERSGIVGKIVVSLLGAAWNIVTYLVVPVLAVEGKGPVDSLKESTALLKRTWGEQLVGNGGVSLVFGLAALIPMAFLFLAVLTGSAAVIVPVLILCVLFWVGLAILGSSVAGVYRTALYVYATTGTPPTGFDPASLTSAFASKPSKVRSFLKERFVAATSVVARRRSPRGFVCERDRAGGGVRRNARPRRSRLQIAPRFKPFGLFFGREARPREAASSARRGVPWTKVRVVHRLRGVAPCCSGR